MDDNFSLGYAMGQNSGGSCNNGGGWGMNGWGDWILILLLFAVLGGGFGFGGGFGGFGGGVGLQGVATRADINAGFQFQDLQNGIRGLTNGLCDTTFALNNSIMQGFHGVDNAICTLGYQTQQGFNGVERSFCGLSHEIADCCCSTQRMIERGFCDINYNLATQANNLMQAGHSDTDRVLAKLDQMEANRLQEKLEAVRMENQTLRFQASQAQQNAFITANQDAQTAELIRRLGRDCPVPAYVVPNPNCCYGNPVGVGYQANSGCGCSCCG